jgi:flagellar hook-associated protein 1 FlgK
MYAAAGALAAFQRSLETISHNMGNVSTPGYARQRVTLQELPFSPDAGLLGGVSSQLARSARSLYAETAVWRSVHAEEQARQKASALEPLSPMLDVASPATLIGSLELMIDAFRAWTSAPNDLGAKTAVMNQAHQFAAAANTTGNQLQWMRSQIADGLNHSVAAINNLVGTVRDYNAAVSLNQVPDATAYAAIEDLNQQAAVSMRLQADGTINLYLGGETPLLLGIEANPIALTTASNGSPQITGSDGQDLTAQIRGGQMAGLLEARNLISSLVGDGQQPGKLNRLVAAYATRVNGILTSGQVTAGPPPVNGTPLFEWNSADPAGVLTSLAVRPGFGPNILPLIDPGPPPVSNGIPLRLARLSGSTDPADGIDGTSFVGFGTAVAWEAANELKTAREQTEDLHAQTEQARNFRTDVSGVSLEEESVMLLTVQRAYESTVRVINVLDEMLQTALTIGA